MRDADPEASVIADGFSCKTQIEQSDAPRDTVQHVVKVIKMALPLLARAKGR